MVHLSFGEKVWRPKVGNKLKLIFFHKFFLERSRLTDFIPKFITTMVLPRLFNSASRSAFTAAKRNFVFNRGLASAAPAVGKVR